MQERLVRVLQERRVRPVRLTEAKKIVWNARVIVATNRDLKREVLEGKFRQDLYYRVRPSRSVIERLALTARENGIISGPDVRCDIESNGLADSTCCQNVESAEPDELREVIISRRLKSLNGDPCL
jgi:transcriptional regulator with GAF, ATPase, and Fis domain